MDKQNVQKEMEPIRLFIRDIYTEMSLLKDSLSPLRFDPKLEFLEFTRDKEVSFLKHNKISIIC
jgi:hypothetical protein